MGHFGFSYVGLVFLLMLIVPNLIWTRHQPKGYNPNNENKALLIFERAGQILVSCTVLIFQDYNPCAWSPWLLWLIAAFVFMLLYECWWASYFKSPKTLADFYSDFLGVPVAGATLPVIAFFLLGIYGKVIWLLISVVILGVGHVGIHLQHISKLKRLEKHNKDYRF